MKPLLVLIFCVFMISCPKKGLTQNDTTFSVKIIREFCDEFSKKNISEFKNSEMELGLLIINVVSKYAAEIEKEWGLNLNEPKDFEKIGEKIGQEAALKCPKFYEFIKNNIGDITSGEEEEIKTLAGKLISIEDNTFSCLLIKTKTGKEEKLWWFEHFEGAEQLIKDKSTFLNNTVEVSYTEIEVYDARLKDYRTIKVMKKISIN